VGLARDILLGAYVTLLLVAAAWDVRRRRIPNLVSGALLLVGVVCSLLSGLAGVALTIAIVYVPWSTGRLGGGDVKLGAAAVAIFGLRFLPEYLLATALTGAAVSLVSFAFSSRNARQEIALNLKLATVGVMPEPALRSGNGRVSVPYGVAFVLAALWLVLVRAR
jgi:Flp pilus assembly protein protease CpaA